MKKFNLFLVVIFIILINFQILYANQKIGIVNMQKVLSEFKEAEEVNDALQQEKDELQAKLDKEQEKLKNKKESYEKKLSKLKEDEKKKAAEELNKDLIKLQDTFQQYSEQLREKQITAFKKLEEKILVAVNEVAKEQGITIVLEKGVVFLGGEDITDLVIERLNSGSNNKTKKTKGK